MQIITKDEILLNKNIYFNKIADGSVFIYPTDTLYALGCNAMDEEAVQKVRDIKNRPKQPFSIIPPSMGWIHEHCIIGEREEEWFAKLPGPYTLIVRLKNKNSVAPNVNPNDDTIGIRVPNHWILPVVNEIDVPLICPSANITGKNFMTSLEDLDSEIKKKADFMIDEGLLKGKPSTLVNLTTDEEEITTRK